LAVLMLAMMSCSKKAAPVQSAAGGEKAYKIAFSNSYAGNAWRTASVNIFNAYSNRLIKEGILDRKAVLYVTGLTIIVSGN
jgi:ABC-type sugar transport system substrate-binding protein